MNANLHNTLAELSKFYCTDKQPLQHNYTPIYESLMYNTRESVHKVVEIGVQNGGSIRMWLDYFQNAQVYGIDFDIECLRVLINYNLPAANRMTLLHGDQKSVDIWNQVPAGIDYVIDDGSHIPDDVIATFTANFHKVRPGGWWIIEDTHCNFHEAFSPKDTLYPWLYKLIYNQQMAPDGIGTGDFYKAVVTSGATDMTKLIFSIRSYKSMIMFERSWM